MLSKKEVEKYNPQSYYRVTSPENVVRATLGNTADMSVDLRITCCGNSVVKSYFCEDYSKRGRRNYYLIYVFNGKMRLYIGDEEHLLHRGNVVCLRPDTTFSFSPVAPEEDTLVYYWTHFTGYECDSMLATSGIGCNTVYTVPTANEMIRIYE